MSTSTKDEESALKIEILLEAARRATWDALKGPKHLRSGRFHPQPSAKEPIRHVQGSRSLANS